MQQNLRRAVSGELKKHIRWAMGEGWDIVRTKNNHLAFKHPDSRTVFFSGTPSDRRAIANHRSQLKRALAEGVQ